MNQAYVIATSTKIDVSGVQVDEKFNDDYFRRPKQEKKAKKTEKEFFASETKETKVTSFLNNKLPKIPILFFSSQIEKGNC